MPTQITWDWVISFSIIGGLILTIWARVSRQTVGELLRDIRDFFQEGGEETSEVIIYD